MSRARKGKLRRKLGLILSVAVFALGLSTAAALGWENEQKPKQHGEQEKGDNDREHGKKEKEKPAVTTPTTPTQTTPTTPTVTTPSPPAAVPAPGPTPSQAPGQPVTNQGAPDKQAEQEQAAPNRLAGETTPTAQSAPLAPVSEQRKLARTGLNPAVIALLGAFCLAGGFVLVRRALAR